MLMRALFGRGFGMQPAVEGHCKLRRLRRYRACKPQETQSQHHRNARCAWDCQGGGN